MFYIMRKLFITFIVSILACQMQAKVQTLTSPNGRIKVEINVADRISYQVSAGNELLLADCQASLQVGKEWLGRNAKLKGVKRSAINQTISNVVPLKNATTQNHANVLTLQFAGNYALEFRAYDNGFAYRFVLNRKGTVDIVDEGMTWRFPEASTLHISKTNTFVTSSHPGRIGKRHEDALLGSRSERLSQYVPHEHGQQLSEGHLPQST